MTTRIMPFLMFTGQAESAMQLYASVFGDAEIETLERYGVGEDGPEGTLKGAVLRLCGQRLRFFDSPDEHAFGFTPAVSLFVDFDSAEELDQAFARLSEGGAVLMPPGAYPFSSRFAWLNDRFGLSWQLNLPRTA